MSRLPALGVALLVAGCHSPEPPAEPPLPDPAAFAAWPSVTEKPVPVPPATWLLCRGPTPEQAAERQAEAAPHGPHAEHTIVVRVNPEAAVAFRARRPVPVGTTVVKEKYFDAAAAGPMTEYTVMTKRPPGYDADGGDWEYAHVDLQPERAVTRGRLGACAGCHRMAAGGTGLFRTYLPPR